MKMRLSYLLFSLLVFLAGCDVHEFPEAPKYANLHLNLTYDTQMTIWDHIYDGKTVVESGLGDVYESRYEGGKIRYVVRATPVSAERGVMSEGASEFIFVKDIYDEYNAEFDIAVRPGTYKVMVWSDFVPASNPYSLYSVGDFSGILMQDGTVNNNEYSDAFKGMNEICLSADMMRNPADTIDITMKRPLAKFEFVANDLPEFVQKATDHVESKVDVNLNAEDYKIRFYYVGFKPDVYNIHTDRPVDSSTGVTFESSMQTLDGSQLRIGFDYVFVGEKSTSVTLQVGVYGRNDEQISLTAPITVPLMRDRHTVLTGAFLTPDASGGVRVDTEYDGDHNWILP